MVRVIEIDTLEYQQTEKIETELNTSMGYEQTGARSFVQGLLLGHPIHTIPYTFFPADSPLSRKEAPRWTVLYRITRQLLHRARCGSFSQKI
jgi:hypothetical protein